MPAERVRAAGVGDDAKVKRLLKAKVGVNSTIGGVNGCTALQAACNNGHVGSARLLLKAKAMLDLRDSYGQTALYYACAWNNSDCAQLMLESKAAIDIASADGCTLLISERGMAGWSRPEKF